MIKIPKPYKYPVNEEDIKKAIELDYLLEEIKSNEFYEQQRARTTYKTTTKISS
jgi:hypothetical protein